MRKRKPSQRRQSETTPQHPRNRLAEIRAEIRDVQQQIETKRRESRVIRTAEDFKSWEHAIAALTTQLAALLLAEATQAALDDAENRRQARPLSQGAGLLDILRVVAGALHRFGQEEAGESVGQIGDLPLPGADVLGIADDASGSAELLDLLLDVVDLGLDLRESMARVLETVLGLGSTTRWVLRHARSPCAGEIGKRRLSAGVGERPIPKATYSFGMLLCR